MKCNRMSGILSILLEKEKVVAKELANYFELFVRNLLDLSIAGFLVISHVETC